MVQMINNLGKICMPFLYLMGTYVLFNYTRSPSDKQLAKEVLSFNSIAKEKRTYGTGFRLRYRGKVYILTNLHVCEVSKMLGYPEYALVDGESFKVSKVLKRSTEHDICALEDTDQNGGLPLSNKDLDVMDPLILIGHPLGLPVTVRRGNLIQKGIVVCVRYDSGARCLNASRISALAYHGNSGSPVFNADGEVAGILFAGSRAYPNKSLIVPYKDLVKFLKELASGK